MGPFIALAALIALMCLFIWKASQDKQKLARKQQVSEAQTQYELDDMDVGETWLIDRYSPPSKDYGEDHECIETHIEDKIAGECLKAHYDKDEVYWYRYSEIKHWTPIGKIKTNETD